MPHLASYVAAASSWYRVLTSRISSAVAGAAMPAGESTARRALTSRAMLVRSDRSALPPGPPWPTLVQTLAWMTRPKPFLRRARERYGDMFTVQLRSGENFVMLADPDVVKEVFTGDPEIFRAGEGNRVLLPLLGKHSVLLLDGKQHLRQRKLLLPAVPRRAHAALPRDHGRGDRARGRDVDAGRAGRSSRAACRRSRSRSSCARSSA